MIWVVFEYIVLWNVIGSCVKRRLYVCIMRGECVNWGEELFNFEEFCFDKVFLLFEGDCGVLGGLFWGNEVGSLIVMWISIVIIWFGGGGKESSLIIVVFSNNWL